MELIELRKHKEEFSDTNRNTRSTNTEMSNIRDT